MVGTATAAAERERQQREQASKHDFNIDYYTARGVRARGTTVLVVTAGRSRSGCDGKTGR